MVNAHACEGQIAMAKAQLKLVDTSKNRAVMAANAVSLPRAGQLAACLETFQASQPVLTVALPSGRAGVRPGRVLNAFREVDPGPICAVPAWSSACLSLRSSKAGGDCEDVFLWADNWAAVAGAGWTGSDKLDAGDLAGQTLVASTPDEHEAWHMLLEGDRPKRILRATRDEAAKLVRAGEAIGIANLAQGYDGLKPVSRRQIRPGTGLWASLKNSARAWDRGWALVEALRAEFAEDRSG